MKRIHYILITVSLLLLGTVVFIGIAFSRSPEYALMQIADDVKEKGFDGLLPHLTEETQETVTNIKSVAESKLMDRILSYFFKKADNTDYLEVIKQHIKDVKWKLVDVLKGRTRTDVVISFDYKDQLTGTVEINMIREDGEWRISGIDLPKVDKIDFK